MNELLVDLNDIRSLILALRTGFAAQFNKNFPSAGVSAVPMQALEQTATGFLAGITKTQFNAGMARLYTSSSEFMPNFSEFRDWCIAKSWMTADEAWSRACKFTQDRRVKITKLTKYALDEVRYLIDLGKMGSAQSNFKSTYNVMINAAQLQGRVQEWYELPKELAQPVHKPLCGTEVSAVIKKAMANINKKTDKPKPTPQELKLGVKIVTAENFWPDPFENPQDYLNSCESDGFNVPIEIRRQLGAIE